MVTIATKIKYYTSIFGDNHTQRFTDSSLECIKVNTVSKETNADMSSSDKPAASYNLKNNTLQKNLF
jgi:hypothetical protein